MSNELGYAMSIRLWHAGVMPGVSVFKLTLSYVTLFFYKVSFVDAALFCGMVILYVDAVQCCY
jgi:hypothetical protein